MNAHRHPETESQKTWRVLPTALVAYAIFGVLLAIHQRGYVNSDFIGYATTAHRCIDGSTRCITAYWSPLFSWCLIPLFELGLNDLVAGRIVLLLSGVVYLVAMYGLLQRLRGSEPFHSVVLFVPAMTCSVLQAVIWSNRLLDPDLLADALLFLYFCTVLDPQIVDKPFRAFGGGIIAGLAYLAKAYMLPFVLAHLAMSFLLRILLAPRTAASPSKVYRPMIAVGLLYLTGLLLIAGPWMCLLTRHYGEFKFSTAGSSNHANMSPTAYDHDPLWHPGLVADFIADPILAPDWSPLQDRKHFVHQLWLIVRNGTTCAGSIAFWLLMPILASIWVRYKKRPSAETAVGSTSHDAWWCVMTLILYCGGYSTVNLEARYFAPVAAPLLCILAVTIISRCREIPFAHGLERRGRSLQWGLMMLALCFAPQDLHRLLTTIGKHSQCAPLTAVEPVATKLFEYGVAGEPTASSRYHEGLTVAYFCGNLKNYLGAPISKAPSDIAGEISASGATVYVKWRRLHPDNPNHPEQSPVALPPSWEVLFKTTDADVNPSEVTVYTRLKCRRQIELTAQASDEGRVAQSWSSPVQRSMPLPAFDVHAADSRPTAGITAAGVLEPRSLTRRAGVRRVSP